MDFQNADMSEPAAATADSPASASNPTPSAGLVLPEGWVAAVAAEVEYQVVEFVGDLDAFDLARIASGLADLKVTPTTRLQEALMKAVYMRTRRWVCRAAARRPAQWCLQGACTCVLRI